MQRTAKHARSTKRPGLVRRLVGRGQREGSPRRETPPADIVDLAGPRDELALARIERLEKGMHMMAETMKATYGRLSAAVEEARRQAVRGASVDQVERMLTQTAGRGNGLRPGPSAEPVLPVLPRHPERMAEPPDALTALRRDRFEREADDH